MVALQHQRIFVSFRYFHARAGRSVDCNIPLITDFQVAKRFTEAIVHKSLADLSIKSWAEHLGVDTVTLPAAATAASRASHAA